MASVVAKRAVGGERPCARCVRDCRPPTRHCPDAVIPGARRSSAELELLARGPPAYPRLRQLRPAAPFAKVIRATTKLAVSSSTSLRHHTRPARPSKSSTAPTMSSLRSVPPPSLQEVTRKLSVHSVKPHVKVPYRAARSAFPPSRHPSAVLRARLLTLVLWHAEARSLFRSRLRNRIGLGLGIHA